MPKLASFFIPYFWAPHLETDMELIHRHLSDGDQVVVHICNGELSTCYSNPEHELHVCNLCANRRRNAFDLTGLGAQVLFKNFLNLTDVDRETISRLRDSCWSTPEDLTALEVNNCHLGKAIYNDLICLVGDTKPNLHDWQNYIKKSVESSLMVLLSFKNHFAQSKPDFFYTFNGRMAIAQAAVSAAEEAGVPYFVHDRADGAINRYAVVQNEPLNSLKVWQQKIDTFWSESACTDDEKESNGSQWFEQRALNRKQSWFSLTEYQSGDLPENFDQTKDNVVIFNSSEWEVAVMEDYRLPFYATQNEGLLQLASALQHYPSMHIYLRVHPILRDKKNYQLSFINSELTNKYPNFTVIPAESKVSTYRLMEKADLVITFGSTTGIEAVYHRTPSLLLGRSFYERLGACDVATSHEDALQYIIEKRFELPADVLEERRKLALKYGYFQQCSGTPYKLFEQTDVFEMRFRGPNRANEAISYDELPFDRGLRKELERRVELSEGSVNPLALSMRELLSVADNLTTENARLRSELEAVKRDMESRNWYLILLFFRIKNAVVRRIRRMGVSSHSHS